jgi:hypothetical protein
MSEDTSPLFFKKLCFCKKSIGSSFTAPEFWLGCCVLVRNVQHRAWLIQIKGVLQPHPPSVACLIGMSYSVTSIDP